MREQLPVLWLSPEPIPRTTARKIINAYTDRDGNAIIGVMWALLLETVAAVIFIAIYVAVKFI